LTDNPLEVRLRDLLVLDEVKAAIVECWLWNQINGHGYSPLW
jgi:hypothetical protein